VTWRTPSSTTPTSSLCLECSTALTSACCRTRLRTPFAGERRRTGGGVHPHTNRCNITFSVSVFFFCWRRKALKSCNITYSVSVFFFCWRKRKALHTLAHAVKSGLAKHSPHVLLSHRGVHCNKKSCNITWHYHRHTFHHHHVLVSQSGGALREVYIPTRTGATSLAVVAHPFA
jgi:hypothetical protein